MNMWVIGIALMSLLGVVAVVGLSQGSENIAGSASCVCGEPGCGPCNADVSVQGCVCGEPGCGPCNADLSLAECVCGEPGCGPCVNG